MKNGHSDPDRLLERVRSEVQRRKLALAPAASQPQAPLPAVTFGQVVTATEPPPGQNKPRLKRARGAIERAAMQNDGARRWPRFLPGLRRNQGAINEALVRAVCAAIQTIESLPRHLHLLETRVGHH